MDFAWQIHLSLEISLRQTKCSTASMLFSIPVSLSFFAVAPVATITSSALSDLTSVTSVLNLMSIHMSRCALNPQTMDGGKYDYKPAKKQKNIAIIGGGIGGMEAAIVLTKRGHKVTIYATITGFLPFK